MTNTNRTTGSTANDVHRLVGILRTVVLGRPVIDPIDKSAPRGTQIRRIAAHNALVDLAKPGEHRYCGQTGHTRAGGPCVLREGHSDADFDSEPAPERSMFGRTYTCMDVEQRDRALRYLIHSDPDPSNRA